MAKKGKKAELEMQEEIVEEVVDAVQPEDAVDNEDPPASEEDEGSRANDETEDLPFEVGKWGGHPQWRCKLCAFDTLKGEAVMWDHLREQHMPPPEPAPTVLIADKSGKEKRS
ncbi:MAG: hypothetical protein DWQ07_14155 [Chloroflexi bacterium]|nr:MAG: hypothetical protein DWQ07_14155 [Chloroflexota bacterium]